MTCCCCTTVYMNNILSPTFCLVDCLPTPLNDDRQSTKKIIMAVKSLDLKLGSITLLSKFTVEWLRIAGFLLGYQVGKS